MKKINYTFLLSSFMALIFMASCSSTKYGAHFQPSSQASYAHKKQDNKDVELHAQQEEAAAQAVEEIAARSGAAEAQSDVLPSAGSLKELMAVEMPDEEELTAGQQEVLTETRERLKKMTRQEKRALKREIRNLKFSDYTKELPAYARDMGELQGDISENTLVLVLLAIFIPPLAVYLHQGEINNKFWISLLLTLLFYLPGQIYSLLVVLDII